MLHIILLLLLDTTIDAIPRPDLVCIDTPHEHIMSFANIVKFKSSLITYNPRNQNFQGNYVTIVDRNINKLANNTFRVIDSQFIIKLFLGNKKISTIESGAFELLDCLHYLELQNNSIEVIQPRLFSKLGQLRTLNLSINKIENIPAFAFANLNLLKSLDLSRNLIKSIDPNSFLSLYSLFSLDLSKNLIENVEKDTFVNMGKLAHLNLSHNHFFTVEPEQFFGLRYLKSLNLGSNNIDHFDYHNNYSFLALNDLRLDRNRISFMNIMKVVQIFPYLNYLDLNENIIDCEDLTAMIRDLKASNIAYNGTTKRGSNVDGVYCEDDFDAFVFNMTAGKREEDKFEIYEIKLALLEDKIDSVRTLTVCFIIVVVLIYFLDLSLRLGWTSWCIDRIRNRRGGDFLSFFNQSGM